MKCAVVGAVLFVCFVMSGGPAEGAKILGVFPMPAPSHYILGSALMRELAERGHDVTVISPFRLKDPPKNGKYRDIVTEDILRQLQEMRKGVNMFDREDMNVFSTILFMGFMTSKVTHGILNDTGVQALIRSDEKFDVVIVGQFLNEAHKVLAAHFGGHLVLFSAVGANNWFNPLVGNPAPSSYVPDLLLPFPGRMTYLQRALNCAVTLFSAALSHCLLYATHNSIARTYIPNAASLYDVIYNTSLVLVNGHNSLNQPVPYVPNMVDIGGFHVQPPKKLPKDLQEVLDGAPEGVVYFSMGSNLKSAELPAEKREAFLRTFARLKQKVLWKWEEDTLPGQPANVKLGKWLPQQDILAHPNVKLFITHGGLLSTTETVYHGVPVLAIPIFGDQKLNAQMAVNSGFGLMLPYKELSEEKLSASLQELLTNPVYTKNAKTRSRLFHDRPMKAMDTAVYWLEYVVRNGGAPHLRVAGLELPWYQYYLLDVAALFVAVGLMLLYVNYVIGRAVYRAICRRFCKSNASGKEQEKEDRKKKQ